MFEQRNKENKQSDQKLSGDRNYESRERTNQTPTDMKMPERAKFLDREFRENL